MAGSGQVKQAEKTSKCHPISTCPSPLGDRVPDGKEYTGFVNLHSLERECEQIRYSDDSPWLKPAASRKSRTECTRLRQFREGSVRAYGHSTSVGGWWALSYVIDWYTKRLIR